MVATTGGGLTLRVESATLGRMKPSAESAARPTPADIHPCLTYEDAPAAIAWLCQAFGFTRRLVVPADDGSVVHSELTLGTGVIMVSSPKPGSERFGPRHPRGGPTSLSVYVADPDAHHRRAVAAGARIVQQPKDEEYGARGYAAEDPEGHRWYFGNYRPGQFWE
jgi:uncharacterized glyoxalase superfamily protein PhnB